MNLDLDLIGGGRGALAWRKKVDAASPHKKNFCLKPLMAGSSSRADWHNEFQPIQDRIQRAESLNFCKELEERLSV